jgi:hypothetical protein
MGTTNVERSCGMRLAVLLISGDAVPARLSWGRPSRLSMPEVFRARDPEAADDGQQCQFGEPHTGVIGGIASRATIVTKEAETPGGADEDFASAAAAGEVVSSVKFRRHVGDAGGQRGVVGGEAENIRGRREARWCGSRRRR